MILIYFVEDAKETVNRKEMLKNFQRMNFQRISLIVLIWTYFTLIQINGKIIILLFIKILIKINSKVPLQSNIMSYLSMCSVHFVY